MTAQVQALLEQAKRLTADERAELVDGLRLLDDDPELWQQWRPELDRRRAELESGKAGTVDAREAIASIRARARAGE